eukprot:scaffold26043_cov73-Skeletonema_marinoi.AAC.1
MSNNRKSTGGHCPHGIGYYGLYGLRMYGITPPHWRRTTNVYTTFLRTATPHVHRYLDHVSSKGFHGHLPVSETGCEDVCWKQNKRAEDRREGHRDRLRGKIP